MSQISDRLYAQARIIPIKPQNRVREVVKLESGALRVVLHSGDDYVIEKDDTMFQAFVVYTVLAEI